MKWYGKLGILLMLFVALTADTEGKAFYIVIACAVLSLILMGLNLLAEYGYIKAKQDREMTKLLSKYKDDYLF